MIAEKKESEIEGSNCEVAVIVTLSSSPLLTSTGTVAVIVTISLLPGLIGPTIIAMKILDKNQFII